MTMSAHRDISSNGRTCILTSVDLPQRDCTNHGGVGVLSIPQRSMHEAHLVCFKDTEQAFVLLMWEHSQGLQSHQWAWVGGGWAGEEGELFGLWQLLSPSHFDSWNKSQTAQWQATASTINAVNKTNWISENALYLEAGWLSIKYFNEAIPNNIIIHILYPYPYPYP